MMNELVALEQGLAGHGWVTVARHPDVSQLLKDDVVRVRLAQDGAFADLDVLTGREIWTLRDGKHNGFPGLKTARGLILLDDVARADHESRWKAAKSLAAKRVEIDRLVAHAVLDPNAAAWPKPSHRARIRGRLTSLNALRDDPQTAAVPAAFERFLATLDLAPPLLHRLYEGLIERARNGGDEWPDPVRAALVGPVALMIDVRRDLADPEFPSDAGDTRQIEAVSRALSDAKRDSSNPDAAASACALTGARTRLLDGNFPQPTLPSLGQTYLFCRNSDIRSLARYGRNGPSSFPIDADLASRLSGTLTAVTAEGRRGRTWRLLPSESGDGRDLFIAFLASSLDERLADAMAAEAEDDDEEETPAMKRARMDHAGSRLVRLFEGAAGKAPGERARILILRTVDRGNRKAVYDRTPTVGALHGAAVKWAQAMRNAPPDITFTLFRDRKAVEGRPRQQAPLSLVPLSRKVYVRGGREAVEAPGLSASEALGLFLDEGERPLRARRVLRLLLERHAGLLAGLAHAKRRDQLKDFDPKATARLDALRSVSWIGGLLFFIGRTKETYMDNTGFKLGQLLSAVDAVHLGYCAEMRGGDVPATLVGNSVFAAAGRNPDRALEVLQTRWKPYHAWATRATAQRRGRPDDERSWAVVRAVSQARHARHLCEELRPALVSMRDEGRTPDETFRAELLLGYVAGIRSETKPDDTADHARRNGI